jgi:hypothetical protein
MPHQTLRSRGQCLNNPTFSCCGAQCPRLDTEGNRPRDRNVTWGGKQGTLSNSRQFYRNLWRFHVDPSLGDDGHHFARNCAVDGSVRACSNVGRSLSVRWHHPPLLFSRVSNGVVRTQVLSRRSHCK